MAIHTPDDPSAPAQPIDIQAWTEEATVAISSLNLSAPTETAQQQAQHMYTPIHISIDEALPSKTEKPSPYKRKEPLRRDSLKRREALLKGKEGSRRRRKWENDRLLSVPNVEPPTPRDWEIHPTHPIHHVPYYLAPLWDAGLARQSAARASASSHQRQPRTVATKPTDPGVVPRELREKLKKARGAKGLLMDLEGEVRAFVERWGEQERRRVGMGKEEPEMDSEDEEIVFVGRNGRMGDLPRSNASSEDGLQDEEQEVQREMMVFETEAGDQAGTFGRWLVHHIGTYYGLRTWSVTRGDPARREAYIGVKETGMEMRAGRRVEGICNPLPRPLWGLV